MNESSVNKPRVVAQEYRIYNPDVHPRQAYLFALHGLTEVAMAQVWDVNENTVDSWKVKYPEFRQALKKGGVFANMNVVEHFYLNCIDRYVDVEEVHMWKGEIIKTTKKHFIQGDKWAQSRWLALKDPVNWSEVQRVQISQTNTNILKVDLSCLTTEELRVYNKIHQSQISERLGLSESGN